MRRTEPRLSRSGEASSINLDSRKTTNGRQHASKEQQMNDAATQHLNDDDMEGVTSTEADDVALPEEPPMDDDPSGLPETDVKD